MSKALPTEKVVCTNRRASFRFEILERIDCGIILRGTEVKSLREKGVSLEEAYARVEDGELWLIGCHISPYKMGHSMNHEPTRPRKLLVHAREVRKLKPKVEQRGLTLVPLRIFFGIRGLAKVTIALARGKKQADKRQTLKTREHKREMDRAVKRRG